ncbi:ExbD/TolR family protein [Megamonas funiformis]|jgi:biopolymer transport protein ExbD|uniref:ExbD/TolR family protein n=1 Tax=Megamonas funiformis TaxID=437897 RepID=UPI00242FE86A|nr:biopolymer transporter ExbD [Megamonas funiformis]
MNIRSNRVARPPRLMIIPMIDIIFFLMVFFLFSTLQMVYQKSMPVNLPVASSSHQEAPKPVAITLMKDGTISIGDTVVDIEEIKPRVEQLADKADTPVILRADENVEHGKVIKVMDEIKSAGVTKLSIATQEK